MYVLWFLGVFAVVSCNLAKGEYMSGALEDVHCSKHVFVGLLGSDLLEAKFLFLGPLGQTAKTVQIFTSDASQTHITIHIPKAQDKYYPLTPP